MKLLAIELENLGALEGHHRIDLERELGDASLFAIVGPTGAGKSTLTDAVVLALFGETPRLSAKKGNEARDPVQLMTRGTGFMRASATIRVLRPEGARDYRATYQQQRARKKAEGAPQLPRRILEVLEVGEWKTIVASEKKKDFDPPFHELLDGMTVEDFYRSVLLAQGEFAAFLRMPADERALMLERLTHSLDYARIGAVAKERFTKARRALEELEASVGQVAALPPEVVTEREARLAAIEERRKQATSERADASLRLDALRAAGEAERTLDEARTALDASEAALAASADDRARLLAHRRAAPVLAAEASLRATRQVIDRLARERGEALGSQAEEEQAHQVSKQALDAAALAHDDAQAWARDERGGLDALDRQALAARTARGRADESGARHGAAERAKEERASRLVASEATLAELREARARALPAHRLASEALGTTSHDEIGRRREALVTEGRTLDRRRSTIERLIEASEAHRLASEELAALALRATSAAQLAESRREVVVAAEEVLRTRGEQLRTLASARDRLVRIAALDEQRRQLVEGTPCVLCGSTTHPVTSDPECAQEFAGATRELEALDQERAALEARLDGARAAVDRARDEAASAQAEVRSIAERQEHAGRALATSGARRDEAVVALDLADVPSLDDARRLERETLDARERIETERSAFEVAVGAFVEAEKTLADATRAQQSGEESLDTHRAELARAETQLLSLRAEAEAATADARRQEEAFEVARAGSDLAARRAELEARPAKAQEAKERAAEAVSRSEKTLAALAARLVELQRQLDDQRAREAELAPVFDAQLAASGFSDLAACADAALAPAEVERLTNALEALAQAGTRARGAFEQAELSHRRAQLALAERPFPEDRDPASVLAERAHELEALAEEKGRLDHALEAHRAAERRLATLATAIAAARREHGIWRRLDALIGTKDGRDFRTFAQTLNLAGVLAPANDELARLAPRYSLVPIPDEVDFVVADAYHAGETRPLSTLSGGEIFLVSLALALGLTRYAAVRRPIETLLLDEGFGTLDPETLGVAMQALEALRVRGTQVGVITHVEALKERIPARVVVERVGNGRSRVRVDAGT